MMWYNTPAQRTLVLVSRKAFPGTGGHVDRLFGHNIAKRYLHSRADREVRLVLLGWLGVAGMVDI